MHEMGGKMTPSLEKTSKMQRIKKCERKEQTVCRGWEEKVDNNVQLVFVQKEREGEIG